MPVSVLYDTYGNNPYLWAARSQQKCKELTYIYGRHFSHSVRSDFDITALTMRFTELYIIIQTSFYSVVTSITVVILEL